MKFTDSATHLNTVINGLQNELLPELVTQSAQANADYLLRILKELLKRERDYPELLPKILNNGLEIFDSIAASLESMDVTPRPKPEIKGYAIDDLNAISSALADLGAQLYEYHPHVKQRLSLLQSAAEWESNAHNQLMGLEPATDLDKTEPPLTREALAAFIQNCHSDGGRTKLTEFSPVMGGFGKQTWAISVQDAEGKEEALIVRKSGRVQTCDHKMFELKREFDLLVKLSAMGIAAPRPLWMGQEVPGADAAFYIMERLPGNPPGSYLEGSTSLTEELVLQWAEVLANLHRIPLTHLADFINQYERPSLLSETMSECYKNNLLDWRNYAEEVGQFSCPTLNFALDWLEQNIPDDPSPPSLIHGDFGIHNMLTDNGKVTGILDWEASTFGSPFIDLSYIKPRVEETMDWSAFIQHYEACGGPKLNPEDLAFYQAYQLMFIMIPMNHTVGKVQSRQMKDPRFNMFELAFIPQFMKNVISVCQ